MASDSKLSHGLVKRTEVMVAPPSGQKEEAETEKTEEE